MNQWLAWRDKEQPNGLLGCERQPQRQPPELFFHWDQGLLMSRVKGNALALNTHGHPLGHLEPQTDHSKTSWGETFHSYSGNSSK